ncbi:MAG: glycoside hydrolase family 2 TIM barrel-domain containing protein [Myxococcota bacterium]
MARNASVARSALAWIGFAVGMLGCAALALTLYLWFGDWPRATRDTVDYLRSVAATEDEPPEPLVMHPGGRRHTKLSGTWQRVVDPGNFPLADLAGWLPRETRPTSPADLVEAAFDPTQTLAVPGDWNSQAPELFHYQGAVWYRRRFEATPSPEVRHVLYFGAANYAASVYLNHRRVAVHRGGFTPFNVDVSEHLRPGENVVIVRVDSRVGALDVPTASTDWFSYGGLTRDVQLLELPRTYLRHYRVALREDESGIRAEFRLAGDPVGGQPVRLEIPELGVVATATSNVAGDAVVSVDAAPERWSPENPRLYEVLLQAGKDAVREEIGFRSFRVEGRDLLLNGEPVFLRGIALHEEAPGGGRAHGEADAKTLLGWAKELHCNFVRLAHYPHDAATVRLADRLGLLVWEEIPVYWNIAFEEPATLALAKQQLGELIERDVNRASVVLWSIANETPAGDARNAFLAELAAHARALDPSRPVTAALLSGPEFLRPFLTDAGLALATGIANEEWELPLEDPLAEIVDVAALNEYFGWYYTSLLAAVTPFEAQRVRRTVLEHLPRLRFTLAAEKPLIVSELGAGALAGRRADPESLAVFSEDLQARVYERQIAMLERQSIVRGVSPWVLMDFRSPMRLLPGVQDFWNRKGLISDAGERKLAFGVLRDWYQQLEAEARAPTATP